VYGHGQLEEIAGKHSHTYTKSYSFEDNNAQDAPNFL
jgi:hypothetical protein